MSLLSCVSRGTTARVCARRFRALFAAAGQGMDRVDGRDQGPPAGARRGGHFPRFFAHPRHLAAGRFRPRVDHLFVRPHARHSALHCGGRHLGLLRVFALPHARGRARRGEARPVLASGRLFPRLPAHPRLHHDLFVGYARARGRFSGCCSIDAIFSQYLSSLTWRIASFLLLSSD